MSKRLLALICSGLLALCCLGATGCASSKGSQDSTEAADASEEQADEASQEAEAEAEAEAEPQTPQEYVGNWQTAGYSADDITVTGDLSAALGPDWEMTLNLEQGGTGTFTYLGEDFPIDWGVVGDTLGIATSASVAGADMLLGYRDSSYQGSEYIAIDFKRDDNMLMLDLGESEQVILTKTGAIDKMPAVDPADLAPITSADDVLGAWRIRAISLEGTTFYGSGSHLFQAIGMEAEDDEVTTLSLGEDGTAVFLGSELEWKAEDDELVLSDGEMELPITSVGEAIAIDIAELSGSPVVLVYAR